MKDSHLLAHHIRLLNGRIFQKLLSQDPEALYRSEQGKILAVLWNSETGCATATDIALETGSYQSEIGYDLLQRIFRGRNSSV